MHKYSVRRRNAKGVLALIDSHGRLHLARTSGYVPHVGDHLRGFAPSLGSCILLDATTDQAYNMIFERVNTDEHLARARIGGSA